MSPLAEAAALVVLLRGGKRRWNVYAELVEERGSAVAVLEEEKQPQTSLFPAASDSLGGADSPECVDYASLLDSATAEIASWQAAGMQLLTVLDPDYPDNLRSVHDRPPLIFIAGRLRATDAKSVAVIGSRTASPRGKRAARAIAEHLVDCEYTVVSGLAAGIDTVAHCATLERGGRTIAVIGTGLTRTYPPQNAALQRQIAARGAVVSQFWPTAPPTRRSFPMRNAVMSGLTVGTVVVEASLRSGARTQVRLALAHGRPVLLLESLLEQPWASECAARPGAHVIRTPADITAVLERLSVGALTA
ncbi:MAG: DNA-processing protein DprA [Solirubrobacteraceae bacterium]